MTSTEITPGGKVALRVEVRTGADGYTQAALQVGGQWLILATIPADAHNGSEDVRRKFIELAGAIALQVVKDAIGGEPELHSMHRMDCAPPGQKGH